MMVVFLLLLVVLKGFGSVIVTIRDVSLQYCHISNTVEF